MMIVTCLSCVNAAQELWPHAVSDRPQPRAGGRVVEHAHHARRPARLYALRPVPKKFRDRAQHADAAAGHAGRGGTVDASPLQRASRARWICPDRARARPASGAVVAARLGQPAFCPRGRERCAARRRDGRGGGSDPGRPQYRPGDHRSQSCFRRWPGRTVVDAPALRGGCGCGHRHGTAAKRRPACSTKAGHTMRGDTVELSLDPSQGASGGAAAALTATGPAPAAAHHPRTRALLHGSIVPTLLRLAAPNVVVMLAQAATGLIETYFVARLGTDALAGMALVFPCVMLMQMISAGAMGGGISSAIARALGGGRREEANALVLHALVIMVAIGVAFSVLMLLFGEQVYRALGGRGGELAAALAYSNVVFAGVVFLWAMNALANVIRGTGNMLVPAAVTCAGVVLLVPLSPVLIFGLGPFPALGIAGGGVALVLFNVAGTVVLAWYVLSGRNLARLRPARLRWPLFRDILRVDR